VKRTQVNANGAVYGLRIRSVPNTLSARLGGLQSTIDYGAVDSITTPTTTALSFALLPWITLSGGIFTLQNDVRSASQVSEVTSPEGTTLTQKLDVLVHEKRTAYGGGIGFDVGHGLRIGGGGLVVATSRDFAVGYLFGGRSGTSTDGLLSSDANRTSSGLGFQPSYGVQWDASKRLHLGVVYRFSELRFSSSGNESTAEVVATGTTSYRVTNRELSAEPMRWVSPARAIAGVAWDASSRARVTLDADLSFGLTADAGGAARKPTVSVRGGVLFKAWDALHLGAGLFVDPATTRRLADTLGSIRANYYGATAGGLLRIRLGKTPSPPVLTTSLAIRYAVGLGDARTATLDTNGLTAGAVDVVVHDLMPYLGTSLAF